MQQNAAHGFKEDWTVFNQVLQKIITTHYRDYNFGIGKAINNNVFKQFLLSLGVIEEDFSVDHFAQSMASIA